MQDIFPWENNNLGGTEVATKWFHKNVLPEIKNLHNYRCISIPGRPHSLEDVFNKEKKNILWLHLTPNQVDDNGLGILKNEEFKETIHKVVVLSNFHKKRTAIELGIDPDNIHVIEYPIDLIPFNESKFENVTRPKIIHASQASRGLDILLQAVYNMDEDFDLEIYNDFYPEQQPENPALDELLKDERITFYGKTPRNTFLKKLSESHIHAYPSIFDETSCLVQAEAMISGNLCVYSNVGVLPETSMGHGVVVDFLSTKSSSELLKRYKESFIKSLEIVKNGEFNPSEQIKDIYEKRNAEKIISKWVDFDNSLE